MNGLTRPNRGGLHDALYQRLGIGGAGTDAQCEKPPKELPNTRVTRESLSARYDMFSRVAEERDLIDCSGQPELEYWVRVT